MTKSGDGFVPLSSVRQGGGDPRTILAEIRAIYFKTSKQTIHDDLTHAIALLMRLPTEEDREKATVYMEGLADMRKEWAAGVKEKTARAKPVSRRKPKA